jgi:hypothetical protein
MRRTLLGVAVAVLALVLVSPVSAKTEAKPVPALRCAHTYAAAMAEAKDRGCIVFATFHADG